MIKRLLQGALVAGVGYGTAVVSHADVPLPNVPLPAAEQLAPMVPDLNGEMLAAFLLFFASEAIGMSKLKDNSVLQLILHLAQELFPYELHRKAPPTSENRPTVRRTTTRRRQP